MSSSFARTLLTTAALVGLSGCASAPAERHWVSVKPVRTPPQTELTGIDGDYAAAVAAIERRDYALALDLLQTANAQKGGDVRVLNAFGVVYDKLGRFDLSSRYYARARTADANSAIVAANQAYSAILQGQSPQTAAPRALASASAPAPVSAPAAVSLSPAPLTEAPRGPVLTVAAAKVFRTAAQPAVPAVAAPVSAPVYLAAASTVAPPARFSPAPVAVAPRAPVLAIVAPTVFRSAAQPAIRAVTQTPAPAASPPVYLAAASSLAPPVRFSPAPVAVASRGTALAMAAPTVFRTASQPAIRAVAPPAAPPANPPVYLPAAPNVAMTAKLVPVPVAEAPPAQAVALASPAIVRDGVQPSLLHTLIQYLMPGPDAEPPAMPVPLVRTALAPGRATPVVVGTHELFAPAGAPVVLRALPQTPVPQGVVQPGVVRLAAISPVAIGPVAKPVAAKSIAQPHVVRLAALSPGAVRTLPAVRRPGLEIADASGRIGAAAPIRLQLAQLGWTTQKGPIALAPRVSRTTITYAAYRAPVALSLARTLPRGVRLVDCGNACGGIRLTLGADSLSWPARIRAALKAFG